jgi:hypothetical protein
MLKIYVFEIFYDIKFIGINSADSTQNAFYNHNYNLK